MSNLHCTITDITSRIFVPIQYPKILFPLNLLVSRVVKPHSFSRSSQLRSLSSGIILVALLFIRSNVSISIRKQHTHNAVFNMARFQFSIGVGKMIRLLYK